MGFLERLNEFGESVEGDFVAADVAAKFVVLMRREHPDELAEWEREQTMSFARGALLRQIHGRRSHAINRARLREVANAFEAGTEVSLSLFRQAFVINAEQVRRPLGQMTGADCSFTANEYTARGNYELAMAAFFTALAKKAKRRTVAAVISEADCARLLRSFLPSAGATALAA